MLSQLQVWVARCLQLDLEIVGLWIRDSLACLLGQFLVSNPLTNKLQLYILSLKSNMNLLRGISVW